MLILLLIVGLILWMIISPQSFGITVLTLVALIIGAVIYMYPPAIFFLIWWGGLLAILIVLCEKNR